MFAKFISTTVIVLALSATQALGHCAIAPQLGVKGTPVRSDVQRPSKNDPCGSTNIAQNLDTSTAVPLSSSNTFQVTAINFNGGQDGSTQVTAEVDPTATGKSFTSATVTKNGQLAPPSAGSAQIEVQLPNGIKCTGGTDKNLCLVSFTTAGGFGNCVVVSQGSGSSSSGSSKSTSTKSNTSNDSGKDTTTKASTTDANDSDKTVTDKVTKTVTSSATKAASKNNGSKSKSSGKKSHKDHKDHKKGSKDHKKDHKDHKKGDKHKNGDKKVKATATSATAKTSSKAASGKLRL